MRDCEGGSVVCTPAPAVPSAPARRGAGTCPELSHAGPEFFDRLLERYWSEENHDFFVTSAAIESAGYCRWPRLKEIVEFSRSMHYQKLGLAFCAALKKEAAVVERVLRNNGFQVVSVICKTGGLDKSRAGVPEECKLQPGQFEAMCNPIAQAELLNSRTPNSIFVWGFVWATTPSSINTPKHWLPPWW